MNQAVTDSVGEYVTRAGGHLTSRGKYLTGFGEHLTRRGEYSTIGLWISTSASALTAKIGISPRFAGPYSAHLPKKLTGCELGDHLTSFRGISIGFLSQIVTAHCNSGDYLT
jgi:hypothetical protein